VCLPETRCNSMKEQIKGTFDFDPADRIYDQHFPGKPVVPGSVIVQAFVTAGKTHGIIMDPILVNNFRFKEFVIPGEHAYTLEVEQDQIKCRLFEDHTHVSNVVVTGAIKRSCLSFPVTTP
jgi:3-hydroxyacyl-[acyl-carrier-protein] dehydratase